MEQDILALSEVGDSNMFSIELIVQSDIVRSDMGEILFSDLVLCDGLSEGVVQSVVGVFEVGNGVGLGVEVDLGVIKFNSSTIKLGIHLHNSGVEAVVLVNKSDVGLFELRKLGLAG